MGTCLKASGIRQNVSGEGREDMEIKAAKENGPKLKLKKEAEIAIHKRSPVVAGKGPQIVLQKKPGSDILGTGSRNNTGNEDDQDEEPGKTADDRRDKVSNRNSSIITHSLMVRASLKEEIPKKPDCRIKEDSKKKAESLRNDKQNHNSGNAGFHFRTGDTKNRNAINNSQAKENYKRMIQMKALMGNRKIRSARADVVLHGADTGSIAAVQAKGVKESKGSLTGIARKTSIGRKTDSKGKSLESSDHVQNDKKLKVKQGEQKNPDQFSREMPKKSRKSTEGKGQRQVIRQRKLQFMLSKLSGNEEQDSMAQMAKDIVRMKVSAVMTKTVQYLGALLAPLSGMLFVAAFPVVLIVVLLYCSPIAAFMEYPSGDTPSIQEVLGGYYMEFNQAVSANIGENGAVSYLHEKDGNYVSNYMDTLMVYMIRYGTGDLGVVMDEKHKRLLKEVFDEMNGFEDKTVTTTVQAGQSLGNVMTSAYCSCSICCGQWAGGPTASGVMPTADHTIAVDASDPFVPMGTRIIMGGKEYVVEDTGAFAQYGVQFDIYFDSHETASHWGHVPMEAFLADGNENTVSVTKKGGYVKNLNFEDYIAMGKLDRKQEEILREAMSAEFLSEIPSSGAGSDVANLALTKVGCQYSQEHRYEEGYYDCSSLVQRCYAQFGISLPAIASTQGQYMVEHGLEVTEDMLEPGDLIFYSYESNGQFRDISHVAIYIGNGRIVHASSPERGVVNDPFSPSNVGLYGRPGRGK